MSEKCINTGSFSTVTLKAMNGTIQNVQNQGKDCHWYQ